ncbi:acyl-CoA dehydrogenase family protein [soil metagenome]
MNGNVIWPRIDELRRALAVADTQAQAGALLEQLVRRGFDRLPLPGQGATLHRWQALAAVAQHDLSLAKLYEGHTDALAIMAELGAQGESGPPARTWGTWAAEAPSGRTVIESSSADGRAALGGAKCWCSGAATASHALLTAWFADGRGPQLVRVAISQPTIEVSAAAWQAVGMAGSASLDVAFDGTEAVLVGGVGDYLSRPGFWQGGAGIAACWYGGSLTIAQALRQSVMQAPAAARSGFRLAALGKVDLALRSTAAVLREAAQWIDAHPQSEASEVALRARLAAERSASLVLDEAGRSLGATPFCRDARFARAAADLPVFIRQSHAERDFAALGERLLDGGDEPWML